MRSFICWLVTRHKWKKLRNIRGGQTLYCVHCDSTKDVMRK
jgi:hypothetical protein